MGLLDGLHKRRWRSRIERYPRIDRDHAAGLQQALREAASGLLGRLPVPARGRWFAGGYRLADLLDCRDALDDAKWYLSSPDESSVARGVAALSEAVSLPGAFVEKLAGFPEQTFQGLLFLWPTTPPVRHLLRVASARVAPGGLLGALVLRDGTPDPTSAVMRRAVKKATGASVKTRPLGNPDAPADMRAWLSEGSCGDAICWADGRNLVFPTGTEARLCLEAISGGAAFPDGLSGQELANTRTAFDALLEEECRAAGQVVLSYEFLGGIAVKAG